jgi:hypothetical protein
MRGDGGHATKCAGHGGFYPREPFSPARAWYWRRGGQRGRVGGEHVMPRVLLIEDDHETANETMAEPVGRGFDVDWAATGIEGLDKARAGKADAMIVDRLLPGVDGPTIIEVVRQERVRTSSERSTTGSGD